MGKGGRRKTVAVKVSDPMDRYFRTYFVRGNPVMTLAPLGPRVKASSPEELDQRTAEAVAEATRDEREN